MLDTDGLQWRAQQYAEKAYPWFKSCALTTPRYKTEVLTILRTAYMAGAVDMGEHMNEELSKNEPRKNKPVR